MPNILTLLADTNRIDLITEKTFRCVTKAGSNTLVTDKGAEVTSSAKCAELKGVWEASAEAEKKGDINGIVIGVINAILGVIGLIAVVMIILGGISYMTSSGDSAKVKKGKDTILYGIIGLVIVGLAFAIVNFVIGNIINKA